jgi:hypothetical protein
MRLEAEDGIIREAAAVEEVEEEVEEAVEEEEEEEAVVEVEVQETEDGTTKADGTTPETGTNTEAGTTVRAVAEEEAEEGATGSNRSSSWLIRLSGKNCNSDCIRISFLTFCHQCVLVQG